MALTIVYILIIALLVLLLWWIVHSLVVKSPLSAVPGPQSASWWKGSFSQVNNRMNGWEFHRLLLHRYGGVARLKMLFGNEQLYVTDPLALHHIIVKDQYIYEETAMFLTSNQLFFGTCLLSSLGEKHKKQRKILNPIFSVKHMRGLLPIFYPICCRLREILLNEVRSGKEAIDVMAWLSRAALEYVGQGGLGFSFNSLDEKGIDYSSTMKQLSPINARLFLYRQFLPYAVRIGSPSFRRRLLELCPFQLPRAAMMISDVVMKCMREILDGKIQPKDKEDLSRASVGKGNDIISVLLKTNSEAAGEDRMPESELLGHMGSLLFAGHDTSTSALCRIFHHLSLRPEAQARLRAEVIAARKKYGDMDYDTLMGLPYLDAIVRETLRLFPPIPQLNRTTAKDVVLPLLWPIMSIDGKTEIREIPIKGNTNVIVSIIGANTNKRIWGEDAEEWRPERWLKQSPESVPMTNVRLPAIYSSTMTFLGGGRACIGFKFAELEIKVTLSLLLEKLVFEPGPEIIWTMNFMQSPILKNSDDNTTQRLPLKLSLVQEREAEPESF